MSMVRFWCAYLLKSLQPLALSGGTMCGLLSDVLPAAS